VWELGGSSSAVQHSRGRPGQGVTCASSLPGGVAVAEAGGHTSSSLAVARRRGGAARVWPSALLDAPLWEMTD
jgi:hypothetical protein